MIVRIVFCVGSCCSVCGVEIKVGSCVDYDGGWRYFVGVFLVFGMKRGCFEK